MYKNMYIKIMASVRCVMRRDKVAEGVEKFIYLQVIIDGKYKFYSLKYKILPKFWDSKKGLVKSLEGRANYINNIIKKKINEIDNIFSKFLLEQKRLTIDSFHNEYLQISDSNGKVSKLTFNKFIEGQISKEINKKLSTIKTYKTVLSRLNQYKAEILFDDIDYKFLVDFELWLNNLYHLGVNGSWKYFKIIKYFVRIAIRMELMKKNPFDHYKLKLEESDRTFLEKSELKKLFDFNDLTPPELKVKNIFLIQCYTGLRFSDVINLKWESIVDKMIILKMEKTNQPVRIPLIEFAVELLKQNKKVDEFVFEKISNQKFNKHLHSIEKKSKLKKSLTSHVARHTFATVALNNGIRLEVVSAILGHKSVKVTQIYAKILDRTMQTEMEKFNLFD